MNAKHCKSIMLYGSPFDKLRANGINQSFLKITSVITGYFILVNRYENHSKVTPGYDDMQAILLKTGFNILIFCRLLKQAKSSGS